VKSLVKIPVVSAAETTLLTACTVAPRIGFVTLSKLVIPFLEAAALRHGLERRISGIHLVDEVMLETTLDTQFKEPGPYIEKFQKAAREAIAAGADAIIPAEAMVATILAINGIREVDNVPIIDGVGTQILAAESAFAMKSRLGIQASRRVAYTLPSDAARKAVLDSLWPMRPCTDSAPLQ
jgi:Asp/Glu/hydantoin racemase